MGDSDTPELFADGSVSLIEFGSDQLPKKRFNHIHWHGNEEERNEIRDQESSTSHGVSHVWETPDVTESDGITDACKPVLGWMVEFFSFSHSIFISRILLSSNWSNFSCISSTFHHLNLVSRSWFNFVLNVSHFTCIFLSKK